jgi:hypothetical protein
VRYDIEAEMKDYLDEKGIEYVWWGTHYSVTQAHTGTILLYLCDVPPRVLEEIIMPHLEHIAEVREKELEMLGEDLSQVPKPLGRRLPDGRIHVVRIK